VLQTSEGRPDAKDHAVEELLEAHHTLEEDDLDARHAGVAL
jgi:hypothetical protein